MRDGHPEGLHVNTAAGKSGLSSPGAQSSNADDLHLAPEASSLGRSGSPPGRQSFFADGAHSKFPCSKLKLDNLFLQWLSTAESQKLVLNLLEEAKHGRPLHGPPSSGNAISPVSPSSAQVLGLSTATPPLSPSKVRSPHSPPSPSRRSGQNLLHQQPGTGERIPPFYFPGAKPVAQDVVQSAQDSLQRLLAANPTGFAVAATKELVAQVLRLPSFLAYPLFYKLLDSQEDKAVPTEKLKLWLERHSALTQDVATCTFDILRKEGLKYLTHDDFKSMLAGILLSHPGLEFLTDTPEFQDRYAETVIYRIFYNLDKTGSGRLTKREIKRGDLLEALGQLDREDDINKVLKYFSYEHFYVIYCKFWELDADHDFLISREDLMRYSTHSLTYRVVDRIFQGAPRKLSTKVADRMGYEDFVWFMLSEEDKSTDVSLEYWFQCVDLDCDGVLRANELLFFYEEQLHRMECLNQEPVLFEDILCQMHDMLAPEKEGTFTLRDLKRHRPLAGIFFNALFNLHKFIAFETRDPFTIRQERENAGQSEWERFASTEYIRLAMEEEGEDEQPEATNDVWDAATEAPF